VAFEQLHGPLLIHERIDFGFAMLTTVLANLNSRRRFKVQEFLPPWYDIPHADPAAGFARLLEMAENGGGAPSPRSPR